GADESPRPLVGRTGRSGIAVHDLRDLSDVQRPAVDAPLRDPVRGGRLPLAVVLTTAGTAVPAGVVQSGDPDPVDPARVSSDLLLLPQGLLPLLLRRPAGMRGGGAHDPSRLQDGNRLPVHPPEHSPLFPLSRVHSALL